MRLLRHSVPRNDNRAWRVGKADLRGDGNEGANRIDEEIRIVGRDSIPPFSMWDKIIRRVGKLALLNAALAVIELFDIPHISAGWIEDDIAHVGTGSDELDR